MREIGALTPGVEALTAVLRAGAADARGRGLRRMYGWLPPEVVDRVSSWGLRRQPRRRALPMILPLDGGFDPAPLARAGEGYLPYHDQF